MMMVAAVCPRCMSFRYRTAQLPDDTPPAADDFEPIPPQQTVAQTGTKATCDVCRGELRFVKGADWEALQGTTRAPANGAQRVRIPSPGLVEIFTAGAAEDVREIRDISGGRLLIVTTRRVVVLDPNAIPEGP